MEQHFSGRDYTLNVKSLKIVKMRMDALSLNTSLLVVSLSGILFVFIARFLRSGKDFFLWWLNQN